MAAKLANMKADGNGSNQHQRATAAIAAVAPISQTQAAKMLNVSRCSVQRAQVVMDIRADVSPATI